MWRLFVPKDQVEDSIDVVNKLDKGRRIKGQSYIVGLRGKPLKPENPSFIICDHCTYVPNSKYHNSTTTDIKAKHCTFNTNWLLAKAASKAEFGLFPSFCPGHRRLFYQWPDGIRMDELDRKRGWYGRWPYCGPCGAFFMHPWCIANRWLIAKTAAKSRKAILRRILTRNDEQRVSRARTLL